jgi:isoaspartyl peptidase/L-asparaginase-like protein (Ntn-hydrolase superfamily)
MGIAFESNEPSSMSNRRTFIRTTALGVIGWTACSSQEAKETGAAAMSAETVDGKRPIVISTWNHGLAANQEAWKTLSANGYSLDAVEAGVRVTEDDESITTVGIGGRPDREGKVTLDACIQNEKSDCGAVSFLQGIKNPISVARRVMEETPHVMLSGKGALQFALEKGFEEEDLLTEGSESAWKEWLEKSEYQPVINAENHDTIGMLAIDAQGRMSGACTTSGAAFKLHGRVGDSPIIGAGLFVDNEVGGAVASGLGEAVIKVAGSSAVVEAMRHGATPQEACEMVVERIIRKHDDLEGLQVGFLAMNMKGEVGAYSVYNGFNYALKAEDMTELIDASSDRNWA